MILRPFVRLLVLSLFSVFPAFVSASTGITGEWRPWSDADADPQQISAECTTDPRGCDTPIGSYVSDLFLRVELDEATGEFTMTSSGDLTADLAPTSSDLTEFKVTFAEAGSAVILVNGPNCVGEDECFEVTETTVAGKLPNGSYVPVVAKEPDDTLTMSINDRFGSLPANMDLASHCYDITKMALDGLAHGQGCRQHVFKLFKNMDPNDYAPTSNSSGVTIGVPYGWKYLPIEQIFGENSVRILESASDIIDAHQRTIGVNVSIGLGPVTFGVSHNETRKSRIENMRERNLTFSEYHYIKTGFALVLDKANAQLDEGFYRKVVGMSQQEDPDFSTLIGAYGTHFSYATTMGERGSLTSTITKENVAKLHEEGVDITTAVTVGVSVPAGPTSASANFGVTTGTSDAHQEKMRSVLGDDFGSYKCEGGTTCDGQRSSGGEVVPVLLDLRPMSDLLAPPFFSDIDNLPEFRVAYAKAIADYAFNEVTPGSNEPSARFYEVESVRVGCGYAYFGANVGTAEPALCKFEGVTISKGNEHMPFNNAEDGSSYFAVLTASGKPIVVPAGIEETFTVSAQVAQSKFACSLGGHHSEDATLAEKELLSGKAAMADPSAFRDGVLTIFLEQDKCRETKGNESVKGRATVAIKFKPVTAAEVLLR